MWSISKITKEIYCFTANGEEPIAIVSMKDHNNQLQWQVEVCMTYLTRIEDFNKLLDELRYFARTMKQQQEKEGCFMNIHCQGLSCFEGESLLPTVHDCNGSTLIDTTFYEEIN